jgi:hypothetical protein
MTFSQLHAKRVAKEYSIILLGILLSCILSLIFDYLLAHENPYPGPFYKINGNSFVFSLSYLILTGFFISFTSPVFGIFFRKHYKYLLLIFISVSMFWFVSFSNAGSLHIAINTLLTCFPMPVSYFFAMRINQKYWQQRTLTHADSGI